MKPIVATYYLKDKDNGAIYSKIEVTDVDRCLIGKCYSAYSLSDYSMLGVLGWNFVADVCCKFDGCTHWHFFGERYDPETDAATHDNEIDAYYHICGPECFIEHIRNMCFIWKVAEMALIDSYDNYDNHLISKVMHSEMIQENYEVNGFTGEIVNKMLEGFTITKE